MRLVIVESPFAGDVKRNVQYARDAMLDCLDRGEAPFPSHLLYPQVLNDHNPVQRKQGIDAGIAWGAKAEATAVYVDFGITDGMRLGIRAAVAAGRRVEYRTLLKYRPGVPRPGIAKRIISWIRGCVLAACIDR